MAKFNVVGLDDVQEAMLRQDAIVEEAVPEMLKAGGAVMQKAQQEEIKTRFNSRRSTGALLASIKVSAVKEIDGGKRVEIYPNGKDKHGVRNAEKGFVLNYGRSNMPARPWFTAANISTHAPLAGHDHIPPPSRSKEEISTHAPLAGHDGYDRNGKFVMNKFQPTRPLRGTTINRPRC